MILTIALLPLALFAALESTRLRIEVDQASGALNQLVDLPSGQNFAKPDGPVWDLQVLVGTNLLTLRSSQAGSVQCETVPGSSQTYRLVWRHFPEPFPAGLLAVATVSLETHEQTARWRLSLDGVDRTTLRQVRFPILQNLAPQAGEYLAVPIWMGQVIADPRGLLTAAKKQPRRSQWHYPGELSMQCLAFWGDRAGLYLACNDTNAFRKAFAVTTDGKGSLGCEILHWPETAPGTRWELPYDVLLGTYTGDWFTVAERYRAWATNQAWAVQSRVAAGQVPQWVSDTALWIWNRGRSDGVLEPAIGWREKLDLPVSVFWHWWHGCAYDTGFPEYLPPREGADRFKRAVLHARKQKVHALAYMNQRLWGMTTQSWSNQNAAAWAVKAEDGKIHPEIYNTFNRAPCASMCLGTAFWRNTYAGLAEQAVLGLGLSGIYMDQACLSLSCYDAAHEHPVGGGAYWVNGFRLLAADLRQRCGAARRDVHGVPALAGEGCGEPWLPQLDVMLSLQVSKERYAGPDGWETIPFFHAVYHPYAVLFGNYSSLTMPPYDELWPREFAPKEPLQLLDPAFSTQFRLEQARSFVWGQQPTLANFTLSQFETRSAEIAYVARLARLRQRFPQYLLRGTLLRPPKVDVAHATIPMSRLSIYAGQQGGLKTFEKNLPLALAASWRAPDGRVAIALAGIADQPLPVRLTIPTREYGVPAGASMYWNDNLQRRKTLESAGAVETLLQLELPPSGLGILEFKSK